MENIIKKWNDEDRHYGHCYDCGLIYQDFVDLYIPDDMWEKINPTYHQGAGLLCPTCILNRLKRLGINEIEFKTNKIKF